MQNSWKTPEFWAALLGQIIGLVVLFGGLTGEQGAGTLEALKAIIGGILSLGTILGFIKVQATRKALAVQLAIARLSAPPTASVEAVNDLANQI